MWKYSWPVQIQCWDLIFSLSHRLEFDTYVCEQWMLWRDYTDAQTRLSLRCSSIIKYKIAYTDSCFVFQIQMTILPIPTQMIRLQCESVGFGQWTETGVIQCAGARFGQSQEREEQLDRWENYCWSDWHYSKHVTPMWFVVRMLAMVPGDGLDVVMLTGIFHRQKLILYFQR